MGRRRPPAMTDGLTPSRALGRRSRQRRDIHRQVHGPCSNTEITRRARQRRPSRRHGTRPRGHPLTGPLLGIQHLTPLMPSGSSIVNVGSSGRVHDQQVGPAGPLEGRRAGIEPLPNPGQHDPSGIYRDRDDRLRCPGLPRHQHPRDPAGARSPGPSGSKSLRFPNSGVRARSSASPSFARAPAVRRCGTRTGAERGEVRAVSRVQLESCSRQDSSGGLVRTTRTGRALSPRQMNDHPGSGWLAPKIPGNFTPNPAPAPSPRPETAFPHPASASVTPPDASPYARLPPNAGRSPGP